MIWTVTFTTQIPAHIFAIYQFVKPARTARKKYVRGVWIKCGWWFNYDPLDCVEQIQPGLTYDHTIYLPVPSSFLPTYFLLVNNCVYVDGDQTSPPLHTPLPSRICAPFPIPAPITIPLATANIRGGSSYSHFASCTWYTLIPHPAGLRMFKLENGQFIQMDPVHAPLPTIGLFVDADSRRSTDQQMIHIISSARDPAVGGTEYHYHLFDTVTDTWVLNEPIAAHITAGQKYARCAIALTAANNPLCVFGAQGVNQTEINFSAKGPWGWSASIAVMAQEFEALSDVSADVSRATQQFTCAAYWSVGGLTIRTREPNGIWTPQHQLMAGAQDRSLVSTRCGPSMISIATAQTVRNALMRYRSEPIWDTEWDLTPAGFGYPSVLAQRDAPAFVAIAYLRKPDNVPTYVKNTGVWSAPAFIFPTITDYLSTTLAPQSVAASIWHGPAETVTWFYAWQLF